HSRRTVMLGGARRFGDDDLLEIVAGLLCLDDYITLDLTATSISDRGLAHLNLLRDKIESLTLNETSITDEGMKHLQGFSKMGTLNLGFTSVGDKGLAELRDLPRLWNLQVGPKVTDEGIRQLDKFRSL